MTSFLSTECKRRIKGGAGGTQSRVRFHHASSAYCHMVFIVQTLLEIIVCVCVFGDWRERYETRAGHIDLYTQDYSLCWQTALIGMQVEN